MNIDVRHDIAKLEADLGAYPKEMMAASVRALNRMITTVRKDAASRMGEQLPGLKVAAIKRQMRLERANSRNVRAAIGFTAKRFRLFGNWAARQTKTGVSLRRGPWRIETGAGEEIPAQALKSAFIQRSRRAGTPNVWLRAGRERYPIEVLVAPSLAEAFRNRALGEALVRVGNQRFAVVLAQETKFRIGQRSA